MFSAKFHGPFLLASKHGKDCELQAQNKPPVFLFFIVCFNLFKFHATVTLYQ